MKKKVLFIFITLLFTLTITSGCRLRLADNGRNGGGSGNGNGGGYYDDTPKKAVKPRSTRATSIEELYEIVNETYVENNPDKYMLVVPTFADQTQKKERIKQVLSWEYGDCGSLDGFYIEIIDMHPLTQEWVDAMNDYFDYHYKTKARITEAYSVSTKQHHDGGSCHYVQEGVSYDNVVKIDNVWYYDY